MIKPPPIINIAIEVGSGTPLTGVAVKLPD
jgi:hypothetical protein